MYLRLMPVTGPPFPASRRCAVAALGAVIGVLACRLPPAGGGDNPCAPWNRRYLPSSVGLARSRRVRESASLNVTRLVRTFLNVRNSRAREARIARAR
jgi:hypothetical protein